MANLLEEKRILTYVAGLLYFYGVMDFEGLYTAVTDNLPVKLDRDTFSKLLDKEINNADSIYEFDFDEDLYINIDVEDPDWVLEEQSKRGEITYRSVSEKEAKSIVLNDYPAVWGPAVKELYEVMQENFGWSSNKALEIILESQDMLKNNINPMEQAKEFMNNVVFCTLEEVEPLIDMVMDLPNHTPLWILKGWTPEEVFEQHEKHRFSPLSDTSFRLSETDEVAAGKYEPCPCDSGRIFKHCCGSPATEVKTEKTLAPPKKKTPASTKPSLEELRALYEAASAFKKGECWEWMYNDDLFGVMDPETNEIAYCCIMGSLGEHYALGAYLGAEGLQSIFSMMSEPENEADTGSLEQLFIQKCLMASFENREHLENEDRANIKKLGLKFRGKNQWPLFRSYEPGLIPWFLSAWECRFLTVSLRQALEVSLRCREDITILNHRDPRTFLVRVPREENGETTWVDQYIEAPPSDKKYISIEITDEVRLRRIMASKRKGKGTWEVDTFFMPFPIQETKAERPYYPKALIVLDASSGLILRYDLLRDINQEGRRFIEAILKLVSDDITPSRIVVDREETYNLLAKACRQLNIPLEKVRWLKFMPQVREEMISRGD